MVVLVTAQPVLPGAKNFVKALLTEAGKQGVAITTIVQNVNDRKTSVVLGDMEKVLYGKGFILDELCGKTYAISPRSFYQINHTQTEVLYGLAVDAAHLTGKEVVLDAYCGIGTIGLTAADHAKQVVGVEVNREAVHDAIGNAKHNLSLIHICALTPFAAQSAANSWLSRWVPTMHTNKRPGAALRLS